MSDTDRQLALDRRFEVGCSWKCKRCKKIIATIKEQDAKTYLENARQRSWENYDKYKPYPIPDGPEDFDDEGHLICTGYESRIREIWSSETLYRVNLWELDARAIGYIDTRELVPADDYWLEIYLRQYSKTLEPGASPMSNVKIIVPYDGDELVMGRCLGENCGWTHSFTPEEQRDSLMRWIDWHEKQK